MAVKRLECFKRLERLEPVGLPVGLSVWNGLNLQLGLMGSNPLFVMALAASGEDRNLMTAWAASESLVLAATPAENTETFCTSGGSGVT